MTRSTLGSTCLFSVVGDRERNQYQGALHRTVPQNLCILCTESVFGSTQFLQKDAVRDYLPSQALGLQDCTNFNPIQDT